MWSRAALMPFSPLSAPTEGKGVFSTLIEQQGPKGGQAIPLASWPPAHKSVRPAQGAVWCPLLLTPRMCFQIIIKKTQILFTLLFPGHRLGCQGGTGAKTKTRLQRRALLKTAKVLLKSRAVLFNLLFLGSPLCSESPAPSSGCWEALRRACPHRMPPAKGSGKRHGPSEHKEGSKTARGAPVSQFHPSQETGGEKGYDTGKRSAGQFGPTVKGNKLPST